MSTLVDTEPVLALSDVTVQFGGIRAVDGASMTVLPGTVRGLIGPNGAGKTTLFDVISGLRRPNSGTVHMAGVDVTTWSPTKRARHGVRRTFQRVQVFGRLSVADNLLVALERRALSVRQQARHLRRRGELPERRGEAGDERLHAQQRMRVDRQRREHLRGIVHVRQSKRAAANLSAELLLRPLAVGGRVAPIDIVDGEPVAECDSVRRRRRPRALRNERRVRGRLLQRRR